MSFKVEIDKEACIGCGACTSCGNIEMNDEGKAQVKEAEVEEIGCNQEAADNCPVNCIKVEEIAE